MSDFVEANVKKQPEVTARTRQNLIDAFWSLYCARRIEEITVREITNRAGYNRGTFYEYFSDVFDVLEHIENSLLPCETEFPPLNHKAVAVPPQAIESLVAMYEQNRKYYVVLLGEKGDPAFQVKIKNHVKPMIRQLLSGAGRAEEFELDYTLEYMLSAMIGILSHWFQQVDAPPSSRLLSLMYDLMANGVMGKLVAAARPAPSAQSI